MPRTQVLQRLERHGLNSLAVVSPMSGEGRTLTAINLAMSIADDPDRTAMLVDLDLWSPSVAARLGVAWSTGVADCLAGRRDPAEVMFRVEDCPKLVVMPGGPGTRLPSELLAGDAARRLSEEWRSRYANRIVIYDLPPLLATDHAIAFLPNVQAALLVVDEGCTRRDDLARCMELLRDTPVLGTVLNRSMERPLGA
jgi:Mrp family chromosome partitioning ATPase